MKPGRVSIVIPTFNDDPDHLMQAVDSALRQTYADVEVLVVDDGSTRHESSAAAASLPSPVRFIRQKNAGVAAARNAGIRASSGEYVLPLDADDWISSITVEKLVATLVSSESVVASFPTVIRTGTGRGFHEAPDQVFLADIAANNCVVSCGLYRRADWGRVGGYPLQDDAPEDWIFWLKLLALGGSLVKANEAMMYYRLRPGSRNTREIDPRLALRRAYEAVPDRSLDMYVSAALEAQVLRQEVLELRGFRNAWRPRLLPLLLVRDQYRRMLTARRSSGNGGLP